jgi:outer membrane murein-binding lipoprotein Lpp
MKNLRMILPAVALAGCLLTPRLFAEKQPHMVAAIQHMRQAQAELEKASHDKGGHRTKAMEHLKAAMAETQAGIGFDNSHETKAEERMEKKHKQ